MQMFRDLFINFTIIVASVTLANLLLRDRFYQNVLRNNLIVGFLAGLLGCVLMLFSVSVTPNVIIDFRNLPIIMMAFYFAPVAAVEASLMIGIFRILYFGLSEASVTAFIIAICIGVISGLVSKMNVSMKIKWFISVTCLCLISGAGIFFLIYTLANRVSIIVIYLASTISGSILMYFFSEYLSRGNRYYERLKDEAELDYLTGLKNNRYFDKSFSAHIQDAIAENRNISLLYIDIDHFKKINDQYGHANGDTVLQELGRILKQTARSHDTVNRRGGEEFTIMLVDCNLANAAHAAERVRRMIEEHDFRLNTHTSVRITVSIGVSSFPETAVVEDKLVEQADTALYQAKRDGRNRVACSVSKFAGMN